MHCGVVVINQELDYVLTGEQVEPFAQGKRS